MPAAPQQPLVLVSACKGERRTLRAGYKALGRHLRSTQRCAVARLEGLTPEALAGAAVLVLGCPTQPFTLEELDALRQFVGGGGGLLALSSEGGETKAGTNLNYLLEEYGLSAACDCAIQSAFRKYPHPKQVLVTDGVLSPDLAAFMAGGTKRKPDAVARYGSSKVDENGAPAVQFAFPHGATVLAQEPAVPILSTGTLAHPNNMAAGAAWWQPDGSSGGRVVLLGSAHMFDDEWLGREDNEPLLDFLLGWLLKDPACVLSPRNLREPDIVDVRPVTHLAELAERPRVCLQEPEELPRDVTRLFAASLFGLDLSFVPQVAALRASLGVPRGVLPLWRPQLEVPGPALQPAIFPPPFREPAPPALELFDLDEEFATPLERLNAVTSRYLKAGQGQAQLEAYVRECAALLGLRSSREGGADAKDMVAEVLGAVVQHKLPDLGDADL